VRVSGRWEVPTALDEARLHWRVKRLLSPSTSPLSNISNIQAYPGPAFASSSNLSVGSQALQIAPRRLSPQNLSRSHPPTQPNLPFPIRVDLSTPQQHFRRLFRILISCARHRTLLSGHPLPPESAAPCISLPSDQPKSYRRLTNLRGDDVRYRILGKRQQKLCTSIAIIGASSPDSQTVTACCAEVFSHEQESNPEVSPMNIVLRLAQNRAIPVAEKLEFQNLVDGLVREVSSMDKAVWSDKTSTFFIPFHP
jgi:hypothetical protein